MSCVPSLTTARDRSCDEGPVAVARDICYLAAPMSKRFTKKKAATSNLDPATLAQQKMFERLRNRAKRTLLKRRRAKSGQ